VFSLVNPIAPPPYAPVTSLSVIERFDAVSTRPGRQAPSIGRCCADSTPSIGDHRFDERVKERVKNRCHRSFGFARSLFLFPPASSPPCFFIVLFFSSRALVLHTFDFSGGRRPSRRLGPAPWRQDTPPTPLYYPQRPYPINSSHPPSMEQVSTHPLRSLLD
jgi:hypothetical protein